ncbi:MAG: hypothetical protein CL596_03205 [Alteromonas sp.]|nr:hypothetical protein [Alteromonas sp.]MAY22659.1 hypothetical protein [Flavobacteriaceae bacterium]|tara:strand:+ start:60432 stop:62045 length:1614 start_codon:yes stop_codon:yes gene_type:complete
MKILNTLPKLGIVFLVLCAFASCEEDFSNLETDIIDQNFSTDVDSSKTVVAYSRPLNGVQSNGLPIYQMGTYTDPFYGKSKAHLLAQVSLGSADLEPDFGDCTQLDSVVLYLPFFSESEIVDEETTYTLDSIFGTEPINISLYESNYYLRQSDPNSSFEDPQYYYSSERAIFESNLGELIHEIEDFTPKAGAIVLNDTVSLAPGLRVKLPTAFFEQKIIDREGSQELSNNNNFREYFRGIYFKVEAASGEGNLTFFDLENSTTPANLTMYYTFKDLTGSETCENTTSDVFDGDVQMLFNAIRVNVFENEQLLPGQSVAAGGGFQKNEETLYLKGGEGSVGIIELFGEEDVKQITEVDGESFLTDGSNGVPDELDELRVKKWLINEANLIFYVDQDKVAGGAKEPERIVIFDTKNNTPLADYSLDITSGQTTVNALTEHLGRIERGSDNNGDFYKIKITTHLSNLINRDSTNIPLGLMVSQNVTQLEFQKLRNNLAGEYLDEVPGTSVISPEGTILHGNLSNNINKRLKLRIYYTDPE